MANPEAIFQLGTGVVFAVAPLVFPNLPPVVLWGALIVGILLMLSGLHGMMGAPFATALARIPLSLPSRQRRLVTTSRWPDFDKWDKRDTFRLFEAACLWINQEPKLPLTRRAKREFDKLQTAVNANRLKTTTQTVEEAVDRAMAIEAGTGWATVNTPVMRAALEMWAAEQDERPLFLFKEMRSA